MKKKIAVEYAALNTPFGTSIAGIYSKLTENRTAFKITKRFDTNSFLNNVVAEIPDIQKSEESILWQVIKPLREQIISWNADYLILATTKGEIDLLENECRNGGRYNCDLSDLLKKSLKSFNISDGMIVSAACASSNSAIAHAAEMLVLNQFSRIAVVGVDIVSKFVYSGFSALQALSCDHSNFPVKPFGVGRKGLIPGEACGAVLLTNDYGKKDYFGKIIGWGASCDANHVTGPSRDGDGLARAVNKAVQLADISVNTISGVFAHGTGTLYNDAMEIKAFKSIFSIPLPVYSLKGALGHTMGASGILETIIALHSLKSGVIPPTCGCKKPDQDADGWVFSESKKITGNYILKTNSGFGGINAALILSP